MQRVKRRSERIARAISGIGSGYNQIIGVPTAKAGPALARKTTKDFEDQEEDFEVVDIMAAREWRAVIKECQKYRKELISINHPPDEALQEDTFVYAGFLKPGRHAVYMYDPETQQFYKKDLIAEFRASDIKTEKRRPTGTSTSKGDSGVADDEDSFFKEWRADDPTNLKLVIQGDLGNPAFTSESLGMDRELYFTVMNHLPTVFPVINEAHKVYMTRGEYPSSSVDKFLKFLQLINLVKPDEEQSEELRGTLARGFNKQKEAPLPKVSM